MIDSPDHRSVIAHMRENISNLRRAIIAVDDDQDDIELMRILFRKADVQHPMRIYRQGDEAITALTKLAEKPEDGAFPLLCFLDIKMPGTTGFDVLRWVRQQRRLDSLSVVMLSSSEHPQDVRLAADQGAQCYLAKYPQPAVLRRVVEEAERLAATNRSAREWFGLPANLLLRWGLSSRGPAPSAGAN